MEMVHEDLQTGFHILVVDDEQGMRDLFAFTLQSEGYYVTTAADGYEALQRVRNASFDLAFIDVKMPEMDGLKTYQAIKEVAPEIAVFMMTGYSVEDLVREAIKEGALGCIYKPFSVEEVLNKVRQVQKDGESHPLPPT
ncbi:MAG: response regulator [Anaerolineae bacterium]